MDGQRAATALRSSEHSFKALVGALMNRRGIDNRNALLLARLLRVKMEATSKMRARKRYQPTMNDGQPLRCFGRSFKYRRRRVTRQVFSRRQQRGRLRVCFQCRTAEQGDKTPLLNQTLHMCPVSLAWGQNQAGCSEQQRYYICWHSGISLDETIQHSLPHREQGHMWPSLLRSSLDSKHQR